MTFTIAQIGEALSARVEGDGSLLIERPSEPATAGPSDIALAMDKTYQADVQAGQANAAILWEGADWVGLGLKAALFVDRPRYAMAAITGLFERPPNTSVGLHPTSIIDPTAQLGENASIGPFCVIGAGVDIGQNARILSHVTIGPETKIGYDALLYDGVRIGGRVSIGNQFIAQPNAVIGADGFSYVTPKPGAIDEVKGQGRVAKSHETQEFVRINSIGGVRIGDRVEVGASTTIDRGTIADTVIGDGTKIDNLVQIGHNVRIGKTCLLCGQVGIGGSAVIEDRVVLGGQVGVADHVTVGTNVIAAGKSAISSNVPPNRAVMGNPAIKMETNVNAYKAYRRLPRLAARLEALEALVTKLMK